MDKAEGGCTSIGISSDAGKNGDAFLANNWDWKPSQRESMVIMKIRQKNGKPDIFMVTEAGIIGKTGYNSAGLCLYLNALSTDQAPKGLPLHIAMRGILDYTTLAEAIAAAVRFRLGCCANFMIGHRNGDFKGSCRISFRHMPPRGCKSAGRKTHGNGIFHDCEFDTGKYLLLQGKSL